MVDMHQSSPDSSPDLSPKASSSRLVDPNRKVTPTERKILETLPSPPPSDERKRADLPASELPQVFIDFKRQCQTGKAAPLTSFPLSKADFARLRDKIQSNFRRFDYDPERERIDFRMPSVLHEFFIGLFGLAVLEGVRELGRHNEEARVFTESINNTLSSCIDLIDGNDVWERQPDAQFDHDEADCPAIVVEVALTQDARRLRKIAHQYIYYTDGDIKVVLCFDLNSDKESTLSVWKPVFYPDPNSDVPKMEIEQVVQTEAFRGADRRPLPGALILQLHNFAPDTLCQDCPNLPLTISFQDMSDMMAKAERRRELRKSRNERTPKRITKRRYVESPEEKIATDDEKRYIKEADGANEKEDRDDEDYKPPKSLRNMTFEPRKKRAQGAGQGD